MIEVYFVVKNSECFCLQNIEQLDLNQLSAFLSVEELSIYHRFLNPERKMQFAAGRLLIKKSLKELGYAGSLPMNGFAVLPSPSGAPQVFGCEDFKGSISISHSLNWVCVIVSAKEAGVGLDIESQAPSALHLFLNEAEQATAKKLLPMLKSDSEVCRLMWSSKEAVHKASRIGFSRGFDYHQLVSASESQGSWCLKFEGSPLNVHSLLFSDWAFSLCCSEASFFIEEIKSKLSRSVTHATFDLPPSR